MWLYSGYHSVPRGGEDDASPPHGEGVAAEPLGFGPVLVGTAGAARPRRQCSGLALLTAAVLLCSALVAALLLGRPGTPDAAPASVEAGDISALRLYGEQPFDCDEGFQRWQTGWSPAKKEYCCKKVGRGCSFGQGTSKPFDCNAGLSNALLAWSLTKKQWCCAHEQKGCPPTTPAPYDCDKDFANYQLAWSPDQKTWCCAHRQRGCEHFDCHSGSPAAWHPDQQQWCCGHYHIGCPLATVASTTPESLVGVVVVTMTATFTRTSTSTVTTTSTFTTTATSTSTTRTITTTSTNTVTTTTRTTTSTTRTTTSTTTTTKTSTTTTTTIFHCDVDRWDHWSERKRHYCCRVKGIGCTTTTVLPYECKGRPDMWDAGKRAWCCLMEHKGCEVSTTLPFDCDAGYVNWECGWSRGKKDWCCHHSGVGCPKTIPYDCETGANRWEELWSAGQRAWCCLHHDIGCDPPPTPSPDYNCLAGLDQWFDLWDPKKQDWCCRHEDRGCYHCDEGLDTWMDGWAVGKKDWCCRHFDKGCEAELRSKECTEEALEAAPIEVSAEGKREWCCRHRSLLCSYVIKPREPFDCEAGFDKWTIAWSEGQKAWCCIHHNRGCDKDDPAQNCWQWVHDPLPSLPTEELPSGPRGVCRVFGDPHVETFDGTHVDFFKQGEFWLVKSQDVLIQARFVARELTNGLSSMFSVVLSGSFLKGHKLEVQPMHDGQILWDGRPILSSFPSVFDTGCVGKIHFDDQGTFLGDLPPDLARHVVHADFPRGVSVEVTRWSHHVNLRVELNSGLNTDGRCGKFNGLPDDDTYMAMKSREAGEQIDAEAFLFEDKTSVSKPLARRFTLDDCHQNKVEHARGLCLRYRPDLAGDMLVACMFDVCFAGDEYASQDGLAASGSAEVTHFQ